MPISDRIRAYVEQHLSVAVIDEPTKIDRGYGNENWKVPTDDGDLLIKIARDLGPDKLAAAAVAHRRAAAGGVPVPELLRVDLAGEAFDGRPVRVLRFLAASHPAEVLITDDAVRRFFTSLGRTLALLHRVPCEGFSSRVGGVTSFAGWAEYVDYRVPQIAQRVAAVDSFGAVDPISLLDRARAVATEVSPVVAPSITHRDLYLDNLLAGPDGSLVAILDFDAAEAWDPAVDLVKLRWQVLPEYPLIAAEALLAGYTKLDDLPPQFERRVWVTEMLELINVVANARAQDNHEFGDWALNRLEAVADAPEVMR
jgi:aminoglycoside phosphotransferase (APT) family kinase protein